MLPGGSPDSELSYIRLEGITGQLQDFSVQIVDSPETVVEQSDAIMIISVDGRVHAEKFEHVSIYRKPEYIDKPFAVSSVDALKIAETAKRLNVPLMSASSLRYAMNCRKRSRKRALLY